MFIDALTKLAIRTLGLLFRQGPRPFISPESRGPVFIIIGGDYIGHDQRISVPHDVQVCDVRVSTRVTQRLDKCLKTILRCQCYEQKRLLRELADEVRHLVRALPTERQQEVAAHLELAVKAATSKKPNRAWYCVSAAGLIEASQFVKHFTANIVHTLQTLGQAIWPDFRLPPN